MLSDDTSVAVANNMRGLKSDLEPFGLEIQQFVFLRKNNQGENEKVTCYRLAWVVNAPAAAQQSTPTAPQAPRPAQAPAPRPAPTPAPRPTPPHQLPTQARPAATPTRSAPTTSKETEGQSVLAIIRMNPDILGGEDDLVYKIANLLGEDKTEEGEGLNQRDIAESLNMDPSEINNRLITKIEESLSEIGLKLIVISDDDQLILQIKPPKKTTTANTKVVTPPTNTEVDPAKVYPPNTDTTATDEHIPGLHEKAFASLADLNRAIIATISSMYTAKGISVHSAHKLLQNLKTVRTSFSLIGKLKAFIEKTEKAISRAEKDQIPPRVASQLLTGAG